MKSIVTLLFVCCFATLVFSQNFGIDQPSPAEKLDVNGNIKASGIIYWGNSESRTETRSDAGLQGNAGARSGFFEYSGASSALHWPISSSGWWHLLDIRHNNSANNYAMQFAGSFFDQNLYFRKTNNNASQAWVKIVTTDEVGTPVVYNYTGGDQYYTVPSGVSSITVKLWGAGGGGGYYGGWSSGFSGGGGGFTKGNLAVTPGQVLTVIVGQGGHGGNVVSTAYSYGGGGRSCNTGSDCRYGGQGGGRSAIRSGSTELMTAGGGGAGGSSRCLGCTQFGGAGGGYVGQMGTSGQYNYGAGQGGLPIAGGAGGTNVSGPGGAGSQFTGGIPGSNAYGGGGGGGWYGGGGGGYSESNTMGGGGGGSGYVGGAGVSNAYTIPGDYANPAGMWDEHYSSGIGVGGITNGTSTPLYGGNGRVVIIPH